MSKVRWKLTDAQWQIIEPLLPKLKPSKRGGRPWTNINVGTKWKARFRGWVISSGWSSAGIMILRSIKRSFILHALSLPLGSYEMASNHFIKDFLLLVSS